MDKNKKLKNFLARNLFYQFEYNFEPMENTKITSEDIQAFRNFENEILGLDSKKIRYKTDKEIESQIKLAVLQENFGPDHTKREMEKLNLTTSDLSNPEIYKHLFQLLENIH
jgi:hypothetical protein